jgi:hypothetical protein
MQLHKQGYHANEAGDGEDADGHGRFLSDIDFSMDDMVQAGQCLEERERGGGVSLRWFTE